MANETKKTVNEKAAMNVTETINGHLVVVREPITAYILSC